MNKCSQFPSYQKFSIYNNSKYLTFSLQNYPNNCIDCDGCYHGIYPKLWDCNAKNDTNTNQQFQLLPINNSIFYQIQSISGQTCIQSLGEGDYAIIAMEICDKTNFLQQWKINEYYISNAINTSLCLTASYYPYNNCSAPPISSYKYCNQQLPTTDRVKDLLSKMSIQQKIQMTQEHNYGVPSLGLPPPKYGEALHGIVTYCGAKYKNNTGCPTSFPHPQMMAASFNRSLWKNIATAISDEGRALYNQKIAGLFYWTPNGIHIIYI